MKKTFVYSSLSMITMVLLIAVIAINAVAQDVTGLVNIRSLFRTAPITGGVITKLRAGTELTLLARNDDASWIYGQIADGRTGWIAQYLVNLPSGVTAQSLPIYVPPPPTPTPSPTSWPTATSRPDDVDNDDDDDDQEPDLPILSVEARCSTESGQFFDLVHVGGPAPTVINVRWQAYKNNSSDGERSSTATHLGTFTRFNEYPGYSFGVRIYGNADVRIDIAYAAIDCSNVSENP